MNQELEIEFKNMLNEEEYNRILKQEFAEPREQMTVQTNYYFDTVDSQLKKQSSALRIRITDSYMELTLKTPSQDFLMETNKTLDEKDVAEILKNKQFKLSSYLNLNQKINLENITENSTFHLFNSMTTNRLEKFDHIHTIVLDKTSFLNDKIDYELEIESEDENLGQRYFNDFLDKYSILPRQSKSKIARAEEYKNQMNSK